MSIEFAEEIRNINVPLETFQSDGYIQRWLDDGYIITNQIHYKSSYFSSVQGKDIDWPMVEVAFKRTVQTEVPDTQEFDSEVYTGG